MAIFNTDLDPRSPRGVVTYDELINQKTEFTEMIDRNIAATGVTNFHSSHIFIVDYDNIKVYNQDIFVSFQLVIANDGDVTFAIFNYVDFSSHQNAITGFHISNDLNCLHSVKSNISDGKLLKDSNIGVPGRYVFELSGGPCREGMRILANLPIYAFDKKHICTHV